MYYIKKIFNVGATGKTINCQKTILDTHNIVLWASLYFKVFPNLEDDIPKHISGWEMSIDDTDCASAIRDHDEFN